MSTVSHAHKKVYEALEDMKVSVIIPSYNSAQYLQSTLESVALQTHQNLEIIIVDDCSIDDSALIAKQFAATDKRVIVRSTDQNSGGPATPRNIGLKCATGDFIAFLDADDLWAPHKTSVQLQALTEHNLDLICSRIRVFTAKESAKTILDGLAPSRKAESNQASPILLLSYKKLLQKNTVSLSSVIVRASVEALEFSVLEHHVAVEDYQLWLTLASQGRLKMAILENELVAYRDSPNSLSTAKLKMAKRIFRLLGEFDLSHIPFGLGRLYYFVSYALLSLRNGNKGL